MVTLARKRLFRTYKTMQASERYKDPMSMADNSEETLPERAQVSAATWWCLFSAVSTKTTTMGTGHREICRRLTKRATLIHRKTVATRVLFATGTSSLVNSTTVLCCTNS